MDAQAPHMGNGGQGIRKLGKPGSGKRQRITAGQDDLADRRIAGQMVEGRAPACGGRGFLGIGEMPAKAVPAMDGAGTGGDQQGAAGVLVQHAVRGPGIKVADRIDRIARAFQQFAGPGQDLQEQGILGITVTHASGKAARHAQAEPGVRTGQQLAGTIGQAKQAEQFVRIGDRFAPQLLPARAASAVAGGRNMGETRACRYHCGSDPGFPVSESPILAALYGRLTLWIQERSMASHGMNDVKNGLKIIVDGYPCTIIDTDFIKPGKGQAFTRVKYRNLKTGRTVEMTMKSTDTVEAADVVDTDMEFLYSDGEFWHFMHPTNHEQIAADENAVADAAKWLKGNEMVIVTLWNGAPLNVTPPNFVELQIVETDPGVRGDTSGGGGKPAKLETGAVVRVPLFVNQNEVVKVDTRTGEYVGRVK
jgi:elongation factor P